MNGMSGKVRRVSAGACVAAVLSIAASSALAGPGNPNILIDLEFRPLNQIVFVGDTVNIGLYARSADAIDPQTMAAANVIFGWDNSFLRLIGIDDTGGPGLGTSWFVPNDIFQINENSPPQDGDAFYEGTADLNAGPISVPTTGLLLTTFQFEALAPTPLTPVDIQTSAGTPTAFTQVFFGDVPNTDITGNLFGASVTIVPEPASLGLLALAGCLLLRRRRA